jgi:hypothetical protein
VVQEFPQRFAADGHPRLRPLSERLRGPKDRFLDLLRRLGCVRRIVDPYIDRAITLGAKARHDARAQDRRLAESRLTEKYRQQLALHAPAKLGDLVLAAVEISPRLFGDRGEAEPRMLFIDGRFRAQLVRRRRRVVTHRARRSGSIASMPDSGA